MQIVIAWVVGSPLLAVLVGKMIALGDRRDVARPGPVAVPGLAPVAAYAGSSFQPSAPLGGRAEAAA